LPTDGFSEKKRKYLQGKGFLAAFVLVLVLLGGPTNVSAQEQTPPSEPAQTASASAPDARYISPAATLGTFLDSMAGIAQQRGDADARRDATGVFDLSGTTSTAGDQLRSQLADVLSRLGPIEPRWLPGDEINDSDTRTFELFPNWEPPAFGPRDAFREARRLAGDDLRLVMQRNDRGAWKFDTTTVENLTDLRRALESMPIRDASISGAVGASAPEWIRGRVPPRLKQGPALGLEPWQWIGLATIAFAGFLADLVVRFVLRLGWRRLVRRNDQESDEERESLKLAVRPFGLFVAALIWFWGVRLVGLPPAALLVILTAARVFLMLASVWAAYRLTDLIATALQQRAGETETKLDDLLIPLLRKTAKVLIAAIGLIYIADSFQIEILPLLTGLGIGGLAFAFAAKDTIENFFGSIAVILDRPFVVGDWVVVDGVEGTVEEMGLRSTRVRTFYNSLITVPNATLVRAQVDNYGKRKYRRFKTDLSVAYGTPPERIEAFCEGIRQIVRDHPYTRKDYYHVWLNRFGAHSLDVLVYVFFETPEWGTELRERHRLMLDIIRLAEKLGVEFAFPTQTLHLVRAKAGPPNPEDPGQHDDLRSMVAGRKAAKEITSDARWRKQIPPPVILNSDSHLEGTEEIESSESSVKQDQTEAKP